MSTFNQIHQILFAQRTDLYHQYGIYPNELTDVPTYYRHSRFHTFFTPFNDFYEGFCHILYHPVGMFVINVILALLECVLSPIYLGLLCHDLVIQDMDRASEDLTYITLSFLTILYSLIHAVADPIWEITTSVIRLLSWSASNSSDERFEIHHLLNEVFNDEILKKTL